MEREFEARDLNAFDQAFDRMVRDRRNDLGAFLPLQREGLAEWADRDDGPLERSYGRHLAGDRGRSYGSRPPGNSHVPDNHRIGASPYNPDDGAAARYDRVHGVPDRSAERRPAYESSYQSDRYSDRYQRPGRSDRYGQPPDASYGRERARPRDDEKYGAWPSPPKGRPTTPDDLGGFAKGTQGYDDWVKHLAFND